MHLIRDHIGGSRGAPALLAALAAALLAQYCFTGEIVTRYQDSNTWEWRPAFTAGVALLAGALLAAALAGRRSGEPSHVAVPGAERRPLGALAPAACLYALALGVYLLAGETALVDLAWLGGVLAFLLPLVRSSARRGALARLGAAAGRASRGEWLAVGALTAVAFGLRFWNLEEIPSHVDNDVALMGVHALRLIEQGDFRWIGASTSEHLLAYDQFLAWSMRLFGTDHAGLVMQSVLLGTLTVPLVYALGRSMFGARVGLIAAALLAVGYTHVHFSRILFGAPPTFAITLVVLLLFLALRTRDRRWFALAGVLSGLTFLLYDSARVIPLVCLAAFLWALVASPGSVRRDATGWALLVAGALIAFGPMAAFVLQDPVGFAGRGNTVALWSPTVWAHQQQGYGTDAPLLILAQQVMHTVLTLHLYGDGSPHFGLPRPMVAATTAALCVLGLGGALRRAGDRRHLLLLAWIGLTFLFGGVLTYDPPYWPHLNLVLPAVALLAGLGAEALIEALAPTPGTARRAAAVALAAATVAFTGVTNWGVYHAFVEDNAGPRVRLARFLADLPDSYRVYLVSNGFHSGEYAFAFFGRGQPIVDLEPDDLAAAARSERGPAVFLLADAPAEATTLTELHPTARVETHLDGGDRPVFVSVTLEPEPPRSQPGSSGGGL
jgi:4-amino-4-deoxy-L-arabinose transferase-like glycosyltransferase